jgi:hypothetical protein
VLRGSAPPVEVRKWRGIANFGSISIMIKGTFYRQSEYFIMIKGRNLGWSRPATPNYRY